MFRKEDSRRIWSEESRRNGTEPPMSFAVFRCNIRRIKRTLPVTPVLGRLRQEDRKFHDSLDPVSIDTLP